MPGMTKIVSKITVPAIRPGSATPTTVTTGIIALRNACRYRTVLEPSPLARAVRT